ncbi:MAG: DUF4190 domain-containing protein [Clostridia bacterium]|nr:DUF4190 domain-containing protein [Clostridia bacterium]MBR5717726.1 DUF4190 domain-containing protein [Clostridia bacterium]
MEFYVEPNNNGSKPSNGMSVGSLVCGIIGLVGNLSFFVVPVLNFILLALSIAAIFMGANGMKQAKLNNEPQGLAVAGLITGIVGTVIGFFGVACVSCFGCMLCSSARNGNLSNMFDFFDEEMGGVIEQLIILK